MTMHGNTSRLNQLLMKRLTVRIRDTVLNGTPYTFLDKCSATKCEKRNFWDLSLFSDASEEFSESLHNDCVIKFTLGYKKFLQMYTLDANKICSQIISSMISL